MFMYINDNQLLQLHVQHNVQLNLFYADKN